MFYYSNKAEAEKQTERQCDFLPKGGKKANHGASCLNDYFSEIAILNK